MTNDQYARDLGSFLTALGAVIEGVDAAQQRLDRIAATRFSLFRYFKENENIISGIFADLLRPNGSHGQGRTFLDLFLEEMDRNRDEGACYRKGLDYASATRCVVETEHVIEQNRRIDLVLRFGAAGDRWIGIENKPWAHEQQDQLKDYAAYVQARDKDAAILYLSGDGSPSKTMPPNERSRYVVIPYRASASGPSVEHWVRSCMERCEAEKVRWFLNDMLEYIREMFRVGGGEEENEDE